MAKIVIIDDEAAILDLMSQLCRRLGHEVSSFQTGKEGMEAISQTQPELLIVDLRIGDMNGLQIIERCQQAHPGMAVIMVTGYGSVETAVEAMKLGAFDYLTKPFELDDLQRTVNRAIESVGAKTTVPQQSRKEFEEVSLTTETRLIGQSSPMLRILELVDKVADNDSPVLLQGEFGAGKQMVARAIHNASERVNAPFKVLPCSSLPEELLEQELFGSASSTNTIFNRAHGGTIVLEEVDMLPVRLQSQLDSFLEDVTKRRMAGQLPDAMDFRFIATCTEKLEDHIAKGTFREDLYYRISIIPIDIPPLRSRREDIPPLAAHFLSGHAKMSGTPVKEIDKYAMKLLDSYGWPGNVAELQNTIERACAFAEDNRIRPVDLPPKITQKVEISDEENEAVKHTLPIGTKLAEFIKKQERMFIRETLKYNEGSREKTASMLGVSIATLYRKMGLKLERDKMLQ
ncbi:MAG: DNA-binding NtrC family response regulator [Verrucomicrobiales bacterium]|jgi:DNA-binding NtrC family response regulator